MSDMTRSAYSEQQLSDLDFLKKTRMDLIKNMVKDELPVHPKELEALNSLISSGEKSIHDTVANKLKFDDNQTNEGLKELVAATLLQISGKNITSESSGGTPKTLGDEYIPNDIVPGELKTESDELVVEEFTGEKE